ncbi:tetratricopeptide repeat protein [Candidatus Uabimicrobium sp. HlEnr_7]|uniref:tetratricopeptide repeat protein n=1 Tax=Candidatus Uabimicrobium helgolandensis TaxID=3095367 RepID=UPI003558069A
MHKINKQQLLFLCSTTVGFFLFYSSYTSKQIQSFITQTASNNFSRKSISVVSPFPEKNFYSYWSGEKRDIFRKVDNYKKLPPGSMNFPKVEISENFYLPPLPITNTIKIIDKESFSAISEQTIVPEISKPKTLRPKYGRLAKILQRKVLSEDLILMNNGKKFSGKIINQNNKEFIIHVIKNKKATNYNLPKKQIQKIYRKIDVENVCKREVKKADSLSLERRILLAEACAQLQQHSLAKKLFEDTIRKFSNNKKPILSFVDYWLDNLEYNNASYWIQKAYSFVVKDIEVERKYAHLLMTLDLNIDFLTTFQKSQNPQDVLEKIAFAVKNKKYKYAQQQLQIISSETSSKYAEGYFYWKAYFEYIDGQFELALKTIENIKESSLWQEKISGIHGAILYLQGNLPAAREALLKSSTPTTLYNLALVYIASNAKEDAQKILDNLEKESIALTHEIACAKAYLSYINGDSSAALDLLEKTLKENPDSFLSHYVAAEIFYKQKNISKAYEHYSTALNFRFSYTPILVRLAEITYRSNNFHDSFVYIKELLKRKDALFTQDTIRIYNLLSQIYIQQKKYTQAKEVLLKSIRISATNIDTLKLFAILANQSGDYNAAVAYLKKVVQVNPKDAYARKYAYEILLNQKSVYWEDTFSRKDNSDIRRGWFEEENNGIVIQLRGSQVFFSGTQRNNNVTQISRKIPAKHFLAISGEITTIAKAYIGIVISSGRSRFFFGKDPDGNIGYGLQKSETVWEWKKVENQIWPKDPVVKIELKRFPGTRTKDNYELYINDILVKKLQMKLSRDLQTGFFGKAEFGIPWSMHADNARIVEIKE